MADILQKENNVTSPDQMMGQLDLEYLEKLQLGDQLGKWQELCQESVGEV